MDVCTKGSLCTPLLHAFGMVQAQRTSANLLQPQPSLWFDEVRCATSHLASPVKTKLENVPESRTTLNACTHPASSPSPLVSLVKMKVRTTSACTHPAIATKLWFGEVQGGSMVVTWRSGWFDCTEPSRSTLLQGKQGVQGSSTLVLGGSSTANLLEPSRTTSSQR